MRSEVAVEEVFIDAEGRLHVRPRLVVYSDYEQIYRAAMGVYWDHSENTLVSPVPRDWDYADWYKQIVASVESEYDEKLVLTVRTQWHNVPADVQDRIQASASRSSESST